MCMYCICSVEPTKQIHQYRIRIRKLQLYKGWYGVLYYCIRDLLVLLLLREKETNMTVALVAVVVVCVVCVVYVIVIVVVVVELFTCSAHYAASRP